MRRRQNVIIHIRHTFVGFYQFLLLRKYRPYTRKKHVSVVDWRDFAVFAGGMISESQLFFWVP